MMAVRVVNLGPFTAGHDWSFIVPGQWYPYLYGVTASLTTATPVTSLPDETGNGNTATLTVGSNQFVSGAPGPYVGGTQDYSVQHLGGDSGVNQAYAVTGILSSLGPATWTEEAWANVQLLQNLGSDIMGITDTTFATEYTSMTVANNANDPYGIRMTINNATVFTVPNVAARNQWHLIAITYDGANANFYRDGVLVGGPSAIVPTLSGNQIRVHVGGNRFSGTPRGFVGATAFYGAALTAGQLAAHAAANSSWSAYRAAVLADTPIGLWGLNTIPSGPNRIVTLTITDGTNTVAQFPASFAAATASSFIWSWQALGPGAQSSTDGQINSVPIPELAIAAGYQIGVKTLDLAGTDVWSQVTIWFDDGTGGGPGGGPGNVAGQYINALLVPDYSQRGP